jgi:light-regulated signal transduction histidine kinase (bacteriophytochrome)
MRQCFARAGAALHRMEELAHRVLEVMTLYSGPTPRIDIDDLPSAAADARVIRQVWCNLIGNALKYSAKRAEPHVQIKGRIEGVEVPYQVEDNGAGFDMRYADRLFGVFQRLHRAEEFSGRGVGLAIVQRIIARHGGRIQARGAPDAGASFEFALPAAAIPDAAGIGVDPTAPGIGAKVMP